MTKLLADHVVRLRNVLITPHTTFNTRQSVRRVLGTTRANVDALIAVRP